MCKREMTLGEEIVGLLARGIDMPTVERMYRKYIEITAEKESKETMKEYCINDTLAIKEFSSVLFARVNGTGNISCGGASYSTGVRPEIWLVKQ